MEQKGFAWIILLIVVVLLACAIVFIGISNHNKAIQLSSGASFLQSSSTSNDTLITTTTISITTTGNSQPTKSMGRTVNITPNQTYISWNDVLTLMQECRLRGVAYDSRGIYTFLKDGQFLVITGAPNLDDIKFATKNITQICGTLPISPFVQ